MLTKYMTKRPGSSKWQLRVPVPKDVQAAYGRKVVTQSLGIEDELAATALAVPFVQRLHAQWNALRNGQPGPALTLGADTLYASAQPSHALRQEIVRSTFEQVLKGTASKRAAAYADNRDAYEVGREARLDAHRRLSNEVQFEQLDRFVEPTAKMAASRGVTVDREAPWFISMVRDVAVATIDARGVSNRMDQGEVDPQPSSTVVTEAFRARPETGTKNIVFSALADQFMKAWIANRTSDKETNTEQQKRATLKLFGGFFEDRPIRLVTDADAAEFADTLRMFDPHWARSPEARRLPWAKLVERYGGQSRGLSDGTMNRHLQVLQEVWTWARKRGHCTGENPFEGFHKKLTPGKNVKPYIAWSDDELRQLWSPPPKRSDLTEVMIVGMYTGMRLNEIASLTWGHVLSSDEGGVTTPYFLVEDAKTPAGNRMIPIHADLGWLSRRDRGRDDERLWSTFNEEGRGKKPGADAGREFTRFKTAKGFISRTKAFHSFRKNVTRMMERAGVPENDWAQIFGHERGFTYRVYNPDGIDMRRRAEIIGLISYPAIDIPHPAR
jgi:integrase